MAYSAEISRNNPTLFVFVIDQSGSMADGVPDSEQPDRRKAEALSLAINRLLQNLVIRCAKEEGVRDYFSVCVIGYGSKVGPAFSGPLAGRERFEIARCRWVYRVQRPFPRRRVPPRGGETAPHGAPDPDHAAP